MTGRMRTGSLVVAVALAVTVAGCGGGDGAEEEAVGQEPEVEVGAATESASIPGPAVVGTAVSGDRVPVVRRAPERAEVWTFDSTSGELAELPPPTDTWLIDPSSAATHEWVVISAATCPVPPMMEDLGPGCGEEAPDALFVYNVPDGRWSSLEIPRRAEAGLGQIVSIAGGSAIISYRRSYDDASLTFSTVDLEGETLTMTPRDDVASAQCSNFQRPAITFSDSDPVVAHIEAAGEAGARTIALSGESAPPMNPSGPSPIPSCHSARDLLVVPRSGEAAEMGSAPYSVYRLGDRITEVASGDGPVLSLVAAPEWFAVTDDRSTVLHRADGTVEREIPNELHDAVVATESAVVLYRPEGELGLSMRAEIVR